MTRDEIIEKIKKLLRMKHGGTPAEVETALALAAELARKHGINLDGVDPDEQPVEPISHIDAATSSRLGFECKYAGLVAQQFFNVNVFTRQMVRGRRSRWVPRIKSEFRLTFVGTEWDTQIALYVYEFLVRAMRRCWSSRENRRLRNRQAFLWGMYLGICSKLQDQQKAQVTGPGLILLGRELARRNDYTSANFEEMKSRGVEPEGDAVASKNAGFDAGLETDIRRGVDGKDAPEAIGLGRLQLGDGATVA